jgi:LCP family protein required for cell wall assembly
MQHDSRPQGWSPQVTDDDYIRFLRGEPVLGLNDAAASAGGPETRATGRRRRRDDVPDGVPGMPRPGESGPGGYAGPGHSGAGPTRRGHADRGPAGRAPSERGPAPSRRQHADPFEQYSRQREIEEHPESHGAAPSARRADPAAPSRPNGAPPQHPAGPPAGYGPPQQFPVSQQFPVPPPPGGPVQHPHFPAAQQAPGRPAYPASAPQTAGPVPGQYGERPLEEPTAPAPGAPSFGQQGSRTSTGFGTGTGAPSFIATAIPAPPPAAQGMPDAAPPLRRGRHAAPDERTAPPPEWAPTAAPPSATPPAAYDSAPPVEAPSWRYAAQPQDRPAGASHNTATPAMPPGAWQNTATPDAPPGAWQNTAAPDAPTGPWQNTATPDAPTGAWQNTATADAPTGPWQNTAVPDAPTGAWQNNVASDMPPGAWQNTATADAPTGPWQNTAVPDAPTGPWQHPGQPSGAAALVDPRLDPWQHPGPANRPAPALDEATSLVAAPPSIGPAAPSPATQPPAGWQDLDATHLHQFGRAAPDLDSPTEMIPPDRLGLAPRPAGNGPDISGVPGADLPGGAGNLGTGLVDPELDPDRIPPRPRRVVAPPRRKRPRWLRVLAWSGAFLGIFMVGVGGFALYEYRKINNNINRVDALAPNDPSIKDAQKQLDAENFLLIGSDTREGANSKYGADKTSGQRSDTTILAHLSPDRQHAVLISFPRDAWVTIPDCQTASGNTVAEHDGMFNSAFETGGPNCTIRTLQRLSGIAINHYVQVDFNGFKSMVDAVGGVPICSTERVYDKDSGLRLNRGQNVLRGEQALSFVRARHALGDGSDLDRIKRQQAFLGSMMRVATSNKILLNPVRLTRFLNAASKSVTLDRQTTLNDLRRLGSQVQGLDPKRVTFLTAPIANRDYDPTGQRATGGGRVLLDAAQGALLWQSIINDKAVPKNAPKSGTPAKPPVNTVTVSPEQVSVKVVNGVGTDRLAGKVATNLGNLGFSISSTANTGERPATSVIKYAPANKAAAITLAAAVPGSALSPDTTLGQRLDLIVGANYTTVNPVQLGQQVTLATPPAAGSGGTQTRSTGPPVKPSPQPSINAGDTSICV